MYKRERFYSGITGLSSSVAAILSCGLLWYATLSANLGAQAGAALAVMGLCAFTVASIGFCTRSVVRGESDATLGYVGLGLLILAWLFAFGQRMYISR